MPSDCQTLRIPLDDSLELVVEIPGSLLMRAVRPEERGTCHGELLLKGTVPKPPPPSRPKIASVNISTTLTGPDQEEQLLTFEVILSVEPKPPPAA